MSTFPVCDDVLDTSVSMLQLADVAKFLSVPTTRVHQMLREQQLIAVRRDGVVMIPETFFEFDEGRPLKGLAGLIAVLSDGGYGQTEILQWMFTDDESLPGRPIDAMHGHLAREVRRRAQAMAF